MHEVNIEEVLDEKDLVAVVIHDDDETPMEFVAELLHTVFKKPVFEAMRLTNTDGDILCGIYPRLLADALLADARQRILAAGHPLVVTSEAPAEGSDMAIGHCKLCDVLSRAKRLSVKGEPALVCDDCMGNITRKLPKATRDEKQFNFACDALAWHFTDIPVDRLVASSRQFPGHMRADVQRAIDTLFLAPIRFFGVHERYRHEILKFAGLVRDGRDAIAIAPAQYHDVDIGESDTVPCLDNGLWLCESDGLRYAVVLSAHREGGQIAGTRIEIAVPAGASGAELVQRCFAELQGAVNAARCYRGKVLSLDADDNYEGLSRGVMVHRLPPVQREEVILPEATVKLLDRNVLNFVGSREKLRRLGQSTRKGILLYGPPGTGKTHTIRYLASNLPGHTTLIITAAQIGLLDHYMALARLLQPAMVVIEDVDLIGRDRSLMGVCEEPLLNRLLNEMDGLKEDADILFVLTTNRPEQLESALAGRPGRVDQAIEVPLPDEVGRGKLVRLYGRGLPLGDAVVAEATTRTKGVSAAFIKELMRRIAQASIARDGGASVVNGDISEALDDMLFTGGRLNVKLLGGAQAMAGE
jgi:ATP-dependent Clp protease adapter protein ClpS